MKTRLPPCGKWITYNDHTRSDFFFFFVTLLVFAVTLVFTSSFSARPLPGVRLSQASGPGPLTTFISKLAIFNLRDLKTYSSYLKIYTCAWVSLLNSRLVYLTAYQTSVQEGTCHRLKSWFPLLFIKLVLLIVLPVKKKFGGSSILSPHWAITLRIIFDRSLSLPSCVQSNSRCCQLYLWSVSRTDHFSVPLLLPP